MQLSQLYMFPLLAQQVRFDGMPSGPFILAGVILEDMVHLLEGSALGFWYEEVGPDAG